MEYFKHNTTQFIRTPCTNLPFYLIIQNIHGGLHCYPQSQICVKLPSKFHFIKHAKLGNVVLILIGHQLLFCEISLVLLSVVSTQHYTVIVLRRPYQMCRMSSLHLSISQRDNISQISFFTCTDFVFYLFCSKVGQLKARNRQRR